VSETKAKMERLTSDIIGVRKSMKDAGIARSSSVDEVIEKTALLGFNKEMETDVMAWN
jgi:hypothetical protein